MGNGETCYHDNPCVVPELNKCANAKCINLPSGYECECDEGFTPSDDKYVCDGNKLLRKRRHFSENTIITWN